MPSQYLRRMVLGWGVEPERVHVIYNALPELPTLRESRDAIRARLGWGNAPTLGDGRPFAALERHRSPAGGAGGIARLFVWSSWATVPTAPAWNRWQRGWLVACNSLGQLPQADALTIMKAADATVLYSAYEGLSHTLLESLRLGTPVVASAVGGNAEVVQHGVNGLLAPHVDVGALRESIREVLQRRDEFAADASAGLDKFSFEAMVSATDKLLRSLLP